MAASLRAAVALGLLATAAQAAEGTCSPYGWASAGAGGVVAGLVAPVASAPADGRAAASLGFDWWRGGSFLLPAARTQRTGAQLGFTTALAPCFEVFGSTGLRSTNLFSEASRQTLVSAGDSTLGFKWVAPLEGRASVAILAEALFPSGVGGFSLSGTGAHAQALLGVALGRVTVSAMAGYRFDESYKLVRGTPATLPAFAYGISNWDRAEAALSGRIWFFEAGLSGDLAVARQAALPIGDRPARLRAVAGFSGLPLGARGVTGAFGVQASLVRAGLVDDRQLPIAGYAPDAPWTVLASVAWAFERPKPRHDEPRLQPIAQQAKLPAPARKTVLHVVVLDAQTQLPLAGAWVSFLEGSDVGATTGPEGRARVEADAGPATLAVAKDGYELLTQPIVLSASEERTVSVSLSQVAPDARVHGKLVSEDGSPLRAAVTVSAAGAIPALPGADVDFSEGSYSFALQHGDYDLVALTPGYRSRPMLVVLRPGETATRDIVFTRILGEPRARSTASGVELSEPVVFAPAHETLDAASFGVLGEVAKALEKEDRALLVVARVAPGELDDEAEAVRLSEARAKAVVGWLVAKGASAGKLIARGAGLAKGSQPLLELRATPPELRPHAMRGTP